MYFYASTQQCKHELLHSSVITIPNRQRWTSQSWEATAEACDLTTLLVPLYSDAQRGGRVDTRTILYTEHCCLIAGHSRLRLLTPDGRVKPLCTTIQ